MKVEPNDPLRRMIVCFQLSRMAAAGRDATSNLLSSAPETGRSSFASRKLPDAIECSRPRPAGRSISKPPFAANTELSEVALVGYAKLMIAGCEPLQGPEQPSRVRLLERRQLHAPFAERIRFG
jgi:hypothetical protein